MEISSQITIEEMIPTLKWSSLEEINNFAFFETNNLRKTQSTHDLSAFVKYSRNHHSDNELLNKKKKIHVNEKCSKKVKTI